MGIGAWQKWLPPAPAARGKPSSERHGEPWPRSALPAQPTPVAFTTVMEIAVVTPGLSGQQAPQDARIGPSGRGGGGILQPLQLQTGKPRSPGKAWLEDGGSCGTRLECAPLPRGAPDTPLAAAGAAAPVNPSPGPPSELDSLRVWTQRQWRRPMGRKAEGPSSSRSFRNFQTLSLGLGFD